MKHRDPGTFQKYYLSRHITADVQAIFRRLPAQEALLRATGGMSRTIDPRRPRRLTPEQSESINHHPVVRRLRQRRDKLRAMVRIPETSSSSLKEQFQEARRELNREKQRQRMADGDTDKLATPVFSFAAETQTPARRDESESFLSSICSLFGRADEPPEEEFKRNKETGKEPSPQHTNEFKFEYEDYVDENGEPEIEPHSHVTASMMCPLDFDPGPEPIILLSSSPCTSPPPQVPSQPEYETPNPVFDSSPSITKFSQKRRRAGRSSRPIYDCRHTASGCKKEAHDKASARAQRTLDKECEDAVLVPETPPREALPPSPAPASLASAGKRKRKATAVYTAAQ